VVSYQVSVEIDTSQPTVIQRNQSGSSSTSGNAATSTSGFTPGQSPPSGFTPPAGFTPGQVPSGFTPGLGAAGQNQTGASASKSYTLRQGMTTTVSIVYQQALNAILIVNQAISTKNNVSTVKVIKDGVITERTVKIGITNSKYTEVTEGLAEGEEVVYYRSLSTNTTTTATNRNQPGVFGGQGGPVIIPGGR
jgi:hypothetical protein